MTVFLGILWFCGYPRSKIEKTKECKPAFLRVLYPLQPEQFHLMFSYEKGFLLPRKKYGNLIWVSGKKFFGFYQIPLIFSYIFPRYQDKAILPDLGKRF